jgi:predicted nucleic acid-binding Zn ribbon protein
VPVLFKGSGFYSTDHGRRSPDNPGRKDEDTKPTSETKAKSEVKAETKPEESG